MLLAMQQLISVHINRIGQETNRVLLEKTLSRQRQLLAPNNAQLLWTESLTASELAIQRKQDKVLDPGHPVNIATVYNLACFYNAISNETNV